MSDPVIEARELAKTYRLGDVEVRALNGVSLIVQHGEFIAVMGSSGSGKSTLMNVLGCLDRPTSGRYLFEGIDVAELAEPELARIRSERIGFVFQSFNLLARTSAVENVALPLFYAGSDSHSERMTRAREALCAVGLGEREHNTPSQLSGGQQQRVAIARALISRPSVLLADEPTGNLDSRTSHEIMETLCSLNREQGVTIVVVTHEADIAAYTNRIITMRDGRVQSDQPNRSVSSEPAGGRTTAVPFRGGLSQAAGSGAAPSRFWAFAAMTLSAAAQALGRNKLRSALTMLGVLIGVAALIAMVAVGRGANEAVRKQIESLGTDLLVVLPGATTTSGVRAGSGSAGNEKTA